MVGTVEDVAFDSGGDRLRGWLHLPPVAGSVPGVVMAHGFSAVKEQYLDRYAEVFVAAGLAVLVYDHPHFGASDGEPRQEVDPVVQQRGYRDAVTYARSRPELDADRLGLWGTSYSGGHVLAVAAVDRRVRCVVSQVPFVDGYTFARRRGSPERQEALLRAFAEDRDDRARGVPPRTLPAVAAERGTPCVMPGPDAYAFFTGTEAFAPAWCNSVTLRSVEMSREYEPGRTVDRIGPTPLLMIVAEDDRITPTDLALDAYERAREPKRLVRLPGGHFGAYLEHFEASAGAARDWFAEHLAP